MQMFLVHTCWAEVPIMFSIECYWRRIFVSSKKRLCLKYWIFSRLLHLDEHAWKNVTKTFLGTRIVQTVPKHIWRSLDLSQMELLSKNPSFTSFFKFMLILVEFYDGNILSDSSGPMYRTSIPTFKPFD